jgi:hypothetical protein
MDAIVTLLDRPTGFTQPQKNSELQQHLQEVTSFFCKEKQTL